MANTTPISNALNIRVANLLNDTPTAGTDDGATASTDGAMFTATVRNSRLNEAYTWLATQLLNRYGLDKFEQYSQGLIATQSITWASGGTTVNQDFIQPLRVVSTGQPQFLKMPKGFLDIDGDIRINRAYAIEGEKIYGYIRTSGTLTKQSSGTATLYYVKADRRDTTTTADIAVNVAPDTTIDTQWLDACMLYAAWRLAKDKGAAEWLEVAASLQSQLEHKFPQLQVT